MTGSDREVTSFYRKSPGSGFRRPISEVLGTFELVQSCNLQEGAVTSHQMGSRDRKCTGGGCRRPISQVFCPFEILQCCNSKEVAVTVTGNDVT